MTKAPTEMSSRVSRFPLGRTLALVAILLSVVSCDGLWEHEEKDINAFMKAVWENPDAQAALMEIHEIVGERIIVFEVRRSEGRITDCRFDSTGPGRNGHLWPDARKTAEPRFCTALQQISDYPDWEGPVSFAFTVPESKGPTADNGSGEPSSSS